MDNFFFEIIQVALGNRSILSRVPSANEWSKLYSMSLNQMVAGVCFYGVQWLPKEQREEMPRG